MATNCTFKQQSVGRNGKGGEASATISLADVTVNTRPNSTGGWETAVVTANLQPRITLTAAEAAANGIAAGTYQKVGPAEFRMTKR